MSVANSASTWRQMPQGDPATGPAVTTTHATGSRSPAVTMAAMADRSAHSVAPKVAFSTLQPAWIRPDRVSKAAPTR